MADTAWPEFDVERSSVRVVLLDADGRVLLFRTVDVTMPEVGTWWELPGGGMEAGETPAQTAARELREETGLVLPEEAFRAPTWRRAVTYCHRHVRVYQHELVLTARVGSASPEPSAEGRTPEELDSYVAHAWFDVDDIEASEERFFPASLPRHLRALLDGALIDEPLEIWN